MSHNAHDPLITKNNLVQCVPVAKVEKFQVRPRETKRIQRILFIKFMLTDRVLVEDITDTWYLVSSEHAVHISSPKTTLLDPTLGLVHKLISNSQMLPHDEASLAWVSSTCPVSTFTHGFLSVPSNTELVLCNHGDQAQRTCTVL